MSFRPLRTPLSKALGHLRHGQRSDAWRGDRSWPKPDPVEAKQTLDGALNHERCSSLLGDAGYESDGFHSLCTDKLGIGSIIPTTDRGRPRNDGKPHPVRGRYRKLIKERCPKRTSGRRWQIETVCGLLKRNMGAALRARNYHGQTREIRLRIRSQNLAIAWRKYDVEYRAPHSPPVRLFSADARNIFNILHRWPCGANRVIGPSP
ncbi:MAG: transposase [Phycisphaerales bacterium]|nr:MAG: transposase [Phycisphaerales bacterium]